MGEKRIRVHHSAPLISQYDHICSLTPSREKTLDIGKEYEHDKQCFPVCQPSTTGGSSVYKPIRLTEWEVSVHVYMFGSISDHSGGFNVRAVAWFTGRYRGIKASYKLLPVENELVRRSDIDVKVEPSTLTTLKHF